MSDRPPFPSGLLGNEEGTKWRGEEGGDGLRRGWGSVLYVSSPTQLTPHLFSSLSPPPTTQLPPPSPIPRSFPSKDYSSHHYIAIITIITTTNAIHSPPSPSSPSPSFLLHFFPLTSLSSSSSLYFPPPFPNTQTVKNAIPITSTNH